MGYLLSDTRFVETSRKTDAKQVELPLYESVMEKTGKPIVFNICVLGAVLELTELVAPESIIKALKTRIPKKINRDEPAGPGTGHGTGRRHKTRFLKHER